MIQTVKVPLTSNVIYVSGTVNGIDKTWTREEDNWWSTTADRAYDGVYRVALSIVYGDGKTASDSITLYYGLVLITDRTQSDVDRAAYLSSLWIGGVWTGTQEELEEWRTDLKGAYNASDLNRVGAAMAYLRDRLNDIGYNVEVDPKLDWRGDECYGDAPTSSDMAAYLSYVGTLRGVISMPDGTPNVPASMDGLTYLSANDIERILEVVDKMITLLIDAFWYSGEVNSGEV